MNEYPRDASAQREMLRAERRARGEPPLPPAQEWCVVAYRLDSAGFPSGAAEAWRAALALDAGLPQAHLGLGRALLELGDGEAAAASIRTAMEADRAAASRGLERLLDDPDDDPWYALGLAEHLRGRIEEAVRAYAKSAERYPWFAEPCLERARAEMARGDRAAAAAACREVIRRAERRPEFRVEAERLLAECEGAAPPRR